VQVADITIEESASSVNPLATDTTFPVYDNSLRPQRPLKQQCRQSTRIAQAANRDIEQYSALNYFIVVWCLQFALVEWPQILTLA